ncbi:unnamed protein product [Arabidopsis halleri]
MQDFPHDNGVKSKHLFSVDNRMNDESQDHLPITRHKN